MPTVQTIGRVVYSKEPIPEEGRNTLDLLIAELDKANNFHAFYRPFERLAAVIGKYEHMGYDVKEYKLHSLEQSKKWRTSPLRS